MKLLFSETNSNYENYQFPYAVWAVPEKGETPADIFDAGFFAVVAAIGPFLSLPPDSRGFEEIQTVVGEPADYTQGQRHWGGIGRAGQIRLYAAAAGIFQNVCGHQIWQGCHDV